MSNEKGTLFPLGAYWRVRENRNSVPDKVNR